MKSSFLIGLFVLLFHYCKSQDTLIGKSFYANRIGHVSLHKLKTCCDTIGYHFAEKWSIIDYYSRYEWDKKTNLKVVNETGDTAWILIKVFMENLIERKTIFLNDDFEKAALKFTPEEFAKIMNGSPWIGMSEDALIFAWGVPDDIHSTLNDKNITKQYVYRSSGGGTYLYFENGRLATIQN